MAIFIGIICIFINWFSWASGTFVAFINFTLIFREGYHRAGKHIKNMLMCIISVIADFTSISIMKTVLMSQSEQTGMILAGSGALISICFLLHRMKYLNLPKVMNAVGGN